MEPDDQSKIPTKPLITPGADEPPPPPPLSDAQMGAMLSAGRSGPRGKWEPPSPEELQRDFPQHEIRGILGRGGMGAVYKGWHRNLDRLVAIKILPPGLDDDGSDFAERFKREAKAMAQLNHPGIVTVYDAGQTSGGLLYFVMECVEGTDLQRLIAERGKLEACEALRITLAVCDALSYAHGHGIIHRDIKPSNIMLDSHGNVKVADFGLAKSTAAGTTVLTMSNVAMGTPDYIAPEILHGAANADQRADLYAVGVMLYQMLTGKVPRGRFEPPSHIVPGLDRRLDRVVDRALQPDPAARYTCAAEFSAAIDPVTRSIARRAPAVTAMSASRKKPRLLAFGALAAVAAVAAVAALVHFAPWKKNGPAVPRATAGEGGKKTGADSAALSSATKDKPFVNSLGMKFVPVPGTKVLFSIWETRVKDYAEYALENTADDSWRMQEKDGVPVGREPEHPVCAVNWDEANAFCVWLTEKQTAQGKLPKGMKYRLPTDEEWSCAVGLASEKGATPREKHEKNTTDFPWGTDYPPPTKVGNYGDESFHVKFPNAEEKWMEDYTDGFATTAPVGSFPPNQYGIFDLGGNVWEWCEDWFDASQTSRVVRGASWEHHDRGLLLSSHRSQRKPANRDNNHGFRCVLEIAPPATPASASIAQSSTPSTATKDRPFVNSLGMKFVPVPGTSTFFSIWDTRVKDYAEYARVNTADDAWTKEEKDGVPVSREPECPVVGVSWNEATAFCVWLTEKESAERRLPKGMRYRLPRDDEWSRATGLAKEDGATPREKNGNGSGNYPWGTAFPPTKGKAGNYADAAFHGTFPNEKNWIEGYSDGYATTSPVGSFAPNQYGLFDMSGNVWQWCEDPLEPGSAERVLRGASWNNCDPIGLLSSSRYHGLQAYRSRNYGFRCVLGASER